MLVFANSDQVAITTALLKKNSRSCCASPCEPEHRTARPVAAAPVPSVSCGYIRISDRQLYLALVRNGPRLLSSL